MLARSNRIAALPELRTLLSEVLAYAVEICAAKAGRICLEGIGPGLEPLTMIQGEMDTDPFQSYPLRLSRGFLAWVEISGARRTSRLVQTFLDRMTGEIEKSLLLEEGQQRLSVQQDLCDCLPQFTAQPDQEQILRLLVQSAQRLLPADAVLLYLADENTGELTLHMSCPEDLVDPSTWVRLPPGAGVIGQAVETRQTYLVTRAASGHQESRPPGWYNGFEPSSILAAPLLAHLDRPNETRVIGGLEALHSHEKSFTDSAARTLQILARQASAAYVKAGQAAEMRRLFLEVVRSLAAAIDLKEPYAEGHSQRVSDIAIAIAARLGVDQQTQTELRIATLLHDVGKIGIPDRILSHAGTLSEAEYKQMQQHPAIGARLLSQAGASTAILEVILQHHERLDGSGYPAGLKAVQTSLWSQIVAVADVFDAMVSDRPYRKGLAVEVVQDYLKSQAGKQFEPRCVEALIAACRNGEIAVPAIQEGVEL